MQAKFLGTWVGDKFLTFDLLCGYHHFLEFVV